MTNKSSNWAKAPKSAQFVKTMREVFGDDVKVIYVEEKDLKLGEPVHANPLSIV